MHDAVMYRNFALLFACAAISACAPITQASTPTAPAPSSPSDGIARASLGERVYVDGPYVTPLEVLEDSRCPENVQCIWAGNATVDLQLRSGKANQEAQSVKMCVGDCRTLYPKIGFREADTVRVSVQGTPHTLILTQVNPYPNTTKPTKIEDYTIKLKIQ